MSEGFSIEVMVRAPIERVWRALRDPAEIRLWHGWDEPGLDAEIQFIYFEHATETDEPYVLVMDPLETFTLDPHEDGTVLRLDRAPKEQAGEWAHSYDAITQGWISFLQQLRFALERHPGRQRRTLVWSATGDPEADLLDDGLLPAPVLGRWFTTDRQDGLVLDELGPGLLVAARQDASLGGPGVMAVLNTYGVADADWDAVRDRWTGWLRLLPSLPCGRRSTSDSPRTPPAPAWP